MTPSLTAVALFAGWMILLMLIVANCRMYEMFAGGRAINSWVRGQSSEGTGLGGRAAHAHLNALENLPVFAALVLAATVSGQPEATDPLAMWVVFARVAQSVTHLIGLSKPLVLARAVFFFAQLILFIAMFVRLF